MSVHLHTAVSHPFKLRKYCSLENISHFYNSANLVTSHTVLKHISQQTFSCLGSGLSCSYFNIYEPEREAV